MTPTAAAAAEVSSVLDTLEALAADLSCHCEVPPDTLILSAQRTRDACAAIEGGVAAMRRILQISVDAGGGPIPPQVAAKLDAASD
jgi:hypothetical protein